MACMMSVHQCRFHWRHGFVRSAPASMTHKTPSVHLRTSLPHAHGSIPERSIVFQMHRSRSLTQRRKIERGGRRSHGQAKMHASNEAPRISTRRRTRQQRREREVSENKSDETASSASPNTIGKHHQRRRYVRSKPPKAMPGGRIINAGQGTLTEVSKSFYVAYGSAELSEATKDLHLVVPVKDELQEVTDEETPAPNPMSLPIITSSEKKDVRFQDMHHGAPPPPPPPPPLWLESPRLSSLCSPESNNIPFTPVEEASLMSALHSGLPPKPSNGQLPLSWYNAPPWVHVKPSMAPFATKYDTHVSSTNDFEGRLFADVFSSADRDGHLIESNLARSMAAHHRAPSTSPCDGDIREREGASAAYSPKGGVSDVALCHAGEDCSYFHLADELMPETKPHVRFHHHQQQQQQQQQPYRPSRYLDPVAVPQLPRNGNELPSFLRQTTPQAPQPPSNSLSFPVAFQHVPQWDAADPMTLQPMGMTPPLSSFPAHLRRLSEINARSLHPQKSFLAECHPLIQSHSNLLI